MRERVFERANRQARSSAHWCTPTVGRRRVSTACANEDHHPDRDQPPPAAARPTVPAAWDPRPRRAFPATVVRVHDDAGHVGVGSGDAMYGFADYERYFIGDRSAGPRSSRGRAGQHRLPRRAARGRSTWRCGTSPGRSRTGRSGRWSAGRVGGSAPTRRRVSCVRPPRWPTSPGEPASTGSPRSRSASGARRSTRTWPSSGRSVMRWATSWR